MVRRIGEEGMQLEPAPMVQDHMRRSVFSARQSWKSRSKPDPETVVGGEFGYLAARKDKLSLKLCKKRQFESVGGSRSFGGWRIE